MSLERIDEMTASPVAGQYYLVPTIAYMWLDRKGEWPVIGPKHEDAEIIKFDWEHYHVDGRFLTTRQWARAERRTWRGASYVVAGFPLAWGRPVQLPHPEPIWKRRRCYRSVVDYPLEMTEKAWGPPLRAAYEARTALRNDGRLICPHRGAPLGSLIPDKHGIVTCPLHGLRWCASTGLPT